MSLYTIEAVHFKAMIFLFFNAVVKHTGGYNQTHYFHLQSVSVGLLQRNKVFRTSIFSLKCSAVQVSTHSYNLDWILLPGIKILYYCFILSPCNLQLTCFPTCHQKQIREIRERMVSMHCLACPFLFRKPIKTSTLLSDCQYQAVCLNAMSEGNNACNDNAINNN